MRTRVMLIKYGLKTQTISGCTVLSKDKYREIPASYAHNQSTKNVFVSGSKVLKFNLPLMSTLRNAQLRKQLKFKYRSPAWKKKISPSIRVLHYSIFVGRYSRATRWISSTQYRIKRIQTTAMLLLFFAAVINISTAVRCR